MISRLNHILVIAVFAAGLVGCGDPASGGRIGTENTISLRLESNGVPASGAIASAYPSKPDPTALARALAIDTADAQGRVTLYLPEDVRLANVQVRSTGKKGLALDSVVPGAAQRVASLVGTGTFSWVVDNGDSCGWSACGVWLEGTGEIESFVVGKTVQFSNIPAGIVRPVAWARTESGELLLVRFQALSFLPGSIQGGGPPPVSKIMLQMRKLAERSDSGCKIKLPLEYDMNTQEFACL